MKRLVICLLSVFAVSPAFAQVSETNPLSQLRQQFETYRKQQPEKIYLHTDRSFYAAGDTVWFKAYLVNPQNFKPHPVSEILHLDLIDENNRSIISQRLQTENGFKAASLILPDTLKTGNYLIQTYTNWQRNAGPQAFYRQPIWINKVPLQAGKTVANTSEKVNLTEAAKKRYALSLKNASDSVLVSITSSENSTAPVYLVLQSHGNLLSADSVMFNAKGMRKKRLFTKNFPEGIVQVSLLNAEMQPESERVFFHRNAQPLQLKLGPDKKVYGRREPVALNLNLTDEAGKPVEAEFSVAVTSNASVSQPTLRKSLLLTSELGAMPDLDFSNADEQDNYLLTQQLRHFSWNAIQNEGKAEPVFSRETALGISGLAIENNVRVNNAVIYLLETNSGKTYLLTSDKEGKLRLPTDGNSFFYQVWQNGLWRENASLVIENNGMVTPSENWNALPSTDSAETKRLNLRRQIDRMYAQEGLRAKVKFVNKDAWPAYPANHYYPLEEYNQLNTMEEILKEMVPSVRVVNRKKKVQANVYNEDTRTFYPNQPLYIIDGQPTWNNDLFLRLDASQLEQVNIYNTAKTLQPFGFMGNNGVIVVFTKSHNYQNPDLSRENILKIQGQNSNSQFVRKDRQANIPDFRPTLYWNPNVQTNAEGKATINFKTSDEMGNLRVQVEGISKDGQLISEELLIPVQPAE